MLFRQLYRSLSSINADKALLAKLRRTTGFTFLACKEALIKHNNDFNCASAWLKEESVRKGWDKAGRLAQRPLSHGLLGVLANNTHAVILEVNCETDFVARNDQFQNLVTSITESLLRKFCENSAKVFWNTDELSSLVLPDCGSRVSDKLVSVIGTLGENMAVRRGIGMSTYGSHGPSYLAMYSHISGGDIKPGIREVQFGKYAAVVRYRPTGEQPPSAAWNERAARLGKQLCQHIVGMNPRPGLDITEPAADPDEEKCLLLQPFLLDENIRVGDHLSRNDMVLEDFVRIECGQEDEPVHTPARTQTTQEDSIPSVAV